MLNIIYILLGALGLGFLVFIHELGHYIVARRVGMKVQVFSIGMGKPIFSWHFQGVKWQICYLLFGGYVKIAGMEREGNQELYDVKDGFFAKEPKDRIKVALAGPVVNIIFAFIAFSGIYFMGGREKPFSEHTKIIGYVDTKSQAFQKGLRPGDTLSELDGRKFKGFNDLLYSSVIKQSQITIKGDEIDYLSDESKPYNFTLDLYPHPNAQSRDFQTFGVLAPAMFLMYEPLKESNEPALLKNASIAQSGIQYGDRIIWADGELVFSVPQLHAIVNKKTALLSVKRDGKVIQVRVPRLPVRDIQFNKNQLSEIDDWQHEIGLKASKDQLAFIPYNIDALCRVEELIDFINEESSLQKVTPLSSNPLDQTLKVGDQILSVDGKAVVSAFQFLKNIQSKRVQLIVDRGSKIDKNILWKNADHAFASSVPWSSIETITAKMGTPRQISNNGNLYLLKPITPVRRMEIDRSEERQQKLDEQIENYVQKAMDIEDVEEQNRMLANLDRFQDELFLGIALQDRTVIYNPPPWTLFSNVCQDILRTTGALFTGALNPKWMSGPVGFIHVMHHGWALGFKEALYWLGMISLGLGFTNLLPIPVLDGGYICFSLWEMITKQRIKAKVMERMIIPFVVLIILFFVFVTYHDIMRLFTRFF